MQFLGRLFGTEFMPHGHCFFWRPDILWLNVGSDALIALAYYSIPLALVTFVRRRADIRFGWLVWMFGAFIFLCGTTHVVAIVTVWNGAYGLEGAVKLLTAGVSVATAIALWPVIPQAIQLPSPSQLEAANYHLRHEIRERERVEAELRSVQSRLEDRVRERTAALEDSNRALEREVEERERAEESFRRAVESAPAGMLIVNAKGTIVLVNEAAEKIFGYPRDELLGAPIEMLVPRRFRELHPAYRSVFLADPRTRAMGAGRELFGLRKGGSEVPIEIGLNPIHTDEGVLVLSSVVDITERTRSESMLRNKTRQLERSNRELDEFAHVVSHDLKAPLRGIASLSAWIAEDCAELLPEASREHLRLLAQRTLRMGELIDGILHYSRIGRADSSPEWIHTDELVRDVIDVLDPPASIRVRVEPPLPRVLYDRTQLAQVFQNLIGNALRHLGKPAGEVVVACRELPDAFEFSVRDDGIGIESKYFERIFRIFQALDPEGSTTGIGLAIVKTIVENHGGAVAVESEVGAGAAFRFTVPRDAGTPEHAGLDAPPSAV